MPRSTGSGSRARWGARRSAKACHAAAMSAGERFPANQLMRRFGAAGDEPVEEAPRALRRAGLAEAIRRVRAGNHVTPINRARQRHVDEAQRLGRFLELHRILDLVLLVADLVAVTEVDDRGAVVVVVFAAFRLRAAEPGIAVPQERAEHDRELEALRLVDGDDLDEIAVRFEAQLRDFVGGAVATLRRQPAQQRIRRFVRRGRLVDLLAQVQQVGESALAVDAAKHAGADPFSGQQLTVHDAHALAQPEVRGNRRSAPGSP